MIADFVELMGAWSWWLLGLLLAIVEIFAPGTFFVWFAVAAIITGAIALLLDLSWQYEILIFVMLAAATALVGRTIYGRTGPPADTRLNDRVARMVGRIGTLDTAIVNGSGHVRLDDSRWRVEGPDMAAGARVRIVGYREGRLQVEAA
jgi:membrane protein implicated in regulation of membrane protease activity